MKRKIAGLIVMVGALIYASAETQFFGNNWWPQSGEEVIADGIALLVCAIGVALFCGGSGRVRHIEKWTKVFRIKRRNPFANVCEAISSILACLSGTLLKNPNLLYLFMENENAHN